MTKLLPLALVGAVALSGCSAINENAFRFTAAAADVKYYYDDAREFVVKADFTEQEQAIVDESIETMEGVKKRLESLPPDRLLDITAITVDYYTLRSAYLELREVVIANKEDYGVREWITLTRFDASSNVLDEQFKELLAQAESGAAVMTALRLADTSIKLASLL